MVMPMILIFLSLSDLVLSIRKLPQSLIEKCIADVRSWFIGNRLMINDAKTEFSIVGTCQQLERTSLESIMTIGDTVIKP